MRMHSVMEICLQRAFSDESGVDTRDGLSVLSSRVAVCLEIVMMTQLWSALFTRETRNVSES
jgi:hypothetical protein